MRKKKFLIVTLVDDNITQLHNHSCHNVFFKYKNFDDLFDVVDIRDYHPEKYAYEVTILDRFAWAALMIWKSFSYKNLVKKFENAKNLVLLTSDLHSWSLFPNLAQLPGNLIDDALAPHCNDDRYLFKFSHTLGIKHLITHYQCPELENIKRFSQINTHIIDYHIDSNIFKDYKLEKKYDIIVYGSTYKTAYPFRYRLKQLLKDSSFNVLIIEPEDNIKGEQLAKLINQSWIGLATVSNFSYLVGKYFEISACNTVVLGNMNSQGKKIWSNNFIYVDETMTDVEISSRIKNALQNRKLLTKISTTMYDIMHNKYTIQEEKSKLYETCEIISASYKMNQPCEIIPAHYNLQTLNHFQSLFSFFKKLSARFNKLTQYLKFQKSNQKV